jgi:predicted methyltransferase
MKITRRSPGWIALTALVVACGGAQETLPPPPPPAAPPPAAEPAAPPPVAAAPQPTPEEQKKEKERQALEADRQKLTTENAAELARFTPELRAQAKTLAEKNYGTARTALTAALASKHRKPGNAERDANRHPIETLEFFGLRPSSVVLESGPGEGWYTELLAPTLAKKGKLYVTMTNPNGPKEERSTFYGERTKLFLERLPEAYGKVETLIVDGKAPQLGLENKLDLVILMRGAHGMYNNKTLGLWLAEYHRALKPNGLLGIEQHRAAPTANPDDTSKHGYLPEPWLIQQVEAAGFKLVAKSEINANPKDTRDHPEGVWALPPTLRNGDKDRAKYVAIGESDRMTLKFQKVALKKTEAPKTGAAPAPATAPAAPKAAAPATPAPAAPPAAPKTAAPATPAPAAPPAAPAAPAMAPKK